MKRSDAIFAAYVASPSVFYGSYFYLLAIRKLMLILLFALQA